MAGMIPRQFIDDLLARADIVELIDSRVPLKKPVKTTKLAARFIPRNRPLLALAKTNNFTTVLVVVNMAMRFRS